MILTMEKNMGDHLGFIDCGLEGLEFMVLYRTDCMSRLTRGIG